MRARPRAQLAHQVLDVGADGVRADAQHDADLLGRVAARELREHQALFPGQPVAAAAPRALENRRASICPLGGHKTRHRLALKTKYFQSVFFAQCSTGTDEADRIAAGVRPPRDPVRGVPLDRLYLTPRKYVLDDPDVLVEDDQVAGLRHVARAGRVTAPRLVGPGV